MGQKERLQQIVRSGEIAQRYLENKESIEKLPKRILALSKQKEDDDGHTIEDVRVSSDPAYQRLGRLGWFLYQRINRRLQLKIPEESSYPFSIAELYFGKKEEKFYENLLTRQVLEEDYNWILKSRPSKFYENFLNTKIPEPIPNKIDEHTANLIDEAWEHQNGRDWEDE